MEILNFPIYQSQKDRFFKAIRSRADVVELWMEAIKLPLLNYSSARVPDVGKILFVAENMNRVFICGESRLFSLNFPFKIYRENAIYSVFTKSGIQIDSKISSDIISLVSNKYNNSSLSLDSILDFSADGADSWNILRDILMCESGYIRFDHDIANVNGTLHPLNHFDVCYSTEASYKLGIDQHVSFELFADILNINTPCHYLHYRN